MALRSTLDRWILPVIVAIGASWPMAAHGQATIEYSGVLGVGVKNAQEARKALPGAPLPELDFDGPAEEPSQAPRAPAAQDPAYAPGPDADQGYPSDYDAPITIYGDE